MTTNILIAGMSMDGMIFKLIDDIIQEYFHDIDMSAKAYRCKKLNPGTRRLKYISQAKEVNQIKELLAFSQAETQQEQELVKEEYKKGRQFWK